MNCKVLEFPHKKKAEDIEARAMRIGLNTDFRKALHIITILQYFPGNKIEENLQTWLSQNLITRDEAKAIRQFYGY